MASVPPTEGYGRGMRRTRRTQRAEEADLNIPGTQESREPTTSIDSPRPPKISPLLHDPRIRSMLYPCTSQDSSSTAMAPLDNTPDRYHADPTKSPSSPGVDKQIIQSGSFNQQIFPSIETRARGGKFGSLVSRDAVAAITGHAATYLQARQPPSQPPLSDEQPSYRPRKLADSIQPTVRSERVTKPQKSHKKTSTAKVSTEAHPKKKQPATPQTNIQDFKTKDQLLQPHKLQIYCWDHPIPTDFLNLPIDLQAAKARVDAAEANLDTDPELDDWHEFCGLESDLLSNLALKSSIGLNFVSRAKRAYRAGRTWTSFELEELTIDSRAGARALKHRREREIALSSSLSNALRLYVFEQLKVRLCHEIWLQPYPDGEDAASLRDGIVGNAPPPPDKTALQLAVQRVAALPDRFQNQGTGSA
jgi:hypothetical protein